MQGSVNSSSFASVLNQIEAVKAIKFTRTASEERMRTIQENVATLNEMLGERKRKLI